MLHAGRREPPGHPAAGRARHVVLVDRVPVHSLESRHVPSLEPPGRAGCAFTVRCRRNALRVRDLLHAGGGTAGGGGGSSGAGGAGGAGGLGGAPGACSDDPCADADLDGDGYIGLADLSILLSNFGLQNAGHEDGDVDGDGDVDLADLSGLLTCYGSQVG